VVVVLQDSCYIFGPRVKIGREWERRNDSQYIEFSTSPAGVLPINGGKHKFFPLLSLRPHYCTAIVGDLKAMKINEDVEDINQQHTNDLKNFLGMSKSIAAAVTSASTVSILPLERHLA